jgi:hypothetical protein
VATYAGDANDAGSASRTYSLTVGRDGTSTTFTFTPPAPVTGETVSLTATVAQNHATSGDPTGTVTFKKKSGATLCSATLTGGSATCSGAYPGATSDTVTATYGGDANHLGSGATKPITVGKASTGTTLTFDPTSAAVGEPVAITATVTVVTPGAGAPTGQVTFVTRTGDDLCSTVALVESGSPATYHAICDTAFETDATDTVEAEYKGDTNFASSTGTAEFDVAKATPQLTVSFSPASPVVGQKVTVTAKVTAEYPGTGTPAPSGTVTFTGTGKTLCGTVSVTAGVATCTTTFGAAGLNTVTVKYLGDANYSTATTSAAVTVKDDTSTTTVTASTASPVVGQTFALTATVALTSTSGGKPAGTVLFTDAAGTLCSTVALGTTAPYTATCTVSYTSPLTDHVTATFTPTASGVEGSTGSVAVTIGKDASDTSVSVTPSTPALGKTATVTATVTAAGPGSGTPTGHVSFTGPGGAVLCSTVTLTATSSNDTAMCATHFDSAVTGGTVTADYTGDTDFLSSSGTATVTVAKAATTTAVSTTPTSGVVGQAIRLKATVAATAGSGAVRATGTVVFSDGGNPDLCTGTLSAVSGTPDTATCTATYTGPVPSDSVTGTFGGDTNFTGSSGATSVTVNKDRTATTIATASPATATVGQAVTLSATVAVSGTGTGTPTGTVTFKGSGGTTLCTGALAVVSGADRATCAAHYASPATDSVRAHYDGGADYTVSTSSTTPVTVRKASTTTAVTSSASPPVVGQPVTYTATVGPVAPATGTPSGTVTFTLTDPAPTRGPGHLPALTCEGGSNTQTLSGGTATCVIATGLVIAQSPVTVAARYTGSASFAGSSTGAPALSQTVGKDGSTVTITATANPTESSKAAHFTAVVAAASPGAGRPTGSVTWTVTGKVGGTVACTTGKSTVNKTTGKVTCNIGAQKLWAADGPYTVTVAYHGDSSFTASTASVTQDITKAGSKTKIAATKPAYSGQEGKITATVTGVPTSAGTPTGSVTFTITGSSGPAVTCTGGDTVALTSGTATCTVRSALVTTGSPYTVSASYGGSSNFTTSASASKTFKVKKA